MVFKYWVSKLWTGLITGSTLSADCKAGTVKLSSVSSDQGLGSMDLVLDCDGYGEAGTADHELGLMDPEVANETAVVPQDDGHGDSEGLGSGDPELGFKILNSQTHVLEWEGGKLSETAVVILKVLALVVLS